VFQWTVLAASDRLIRNNPQLLRALIRACVRSSRAARDDADQFVHFVAERFGVPLGVARASLGRESSHYEFDGRMDMAGLSKAIEVQSSLHAQRSVLPEDLTDLRFLPQ
jgi:ABC-type nitrate/sulfonate/bicarbonate transport system substrate-binding protein